MSTGRPHHYGHLLQVYKESLQPLTLYTSFHDLINVYSRRSGADNPRGQNFDVNRNLFSLQLLATSFKKISLKSDFIQFFFMILYMYIHVAPGQGLTTPRGRNFYVNRNILTLWSFVWFYAIFFMILYMYIAPGQGQTAPRGQSFNVNRNVLSFHSFDAGFKKMPLKSDFIQFVLWFVDNDDNDDENGRQSKGIL